MSDRPTKKCNETPVDDALAEKGARSNLVQPNLAPLPGKCLDLSKDGKHPIFRQMLLPDSIDIKPSQAENEEDGKIEEEDTTEVNLLPVITHDAGSTPFARNRLVDQTAGLLNSPIPLDFLPTNIAFKQLSGLKANNRPSVSELSETEFSQSQSLSLPQIATPEARETAPEPEIERQEKKCPFPNCFGACFNFCKQRKREERKPDISAPQRTPEREANQAVEQQGPVQHDSEAQISRAQQANSSGQNNSPQVKRQFLNPSKLFKGRKSNEPSAPLQEENPVEPSEQSAKEEIPKQTTIQSSETDTLDRSTDAGAIELNEIVPNANK